MSYWTYVSAVADVVIPDGLENASDEQLVETIFGKSLDFDEMTEDLWEDEPNVYMPMGSEGSLKAAVSRINYYTARISIYGSLRDYCKRPEKIIEWFKRKCENVETNGLVCIRVESDIYGIYKTML